MHENMQQPRFRGRVRAAVIAASLCLAVGCASTPQSTRLRASDFDVTVSEIVAQLAASDFLAERTPADPQFRIVTRSVENLTSDVLTQSEMWTAVARIQAALPLRQLAERKNIVFQMPPEQVEALRRIGLDSPPTPQNRPTHVLTAVFRSATRSGASPGTRFTDLRKEYYYFDYRIVNLATRELAWSGSVEFARAAVGLAIN